MNVLTSEYVRRVDVHLGVVLHILVAVCRVEIKGPYENEQTQGKRGIYQILKGVLLVVNCRSPEDRWTGCSHPQDILGIDAEFLSH